MVRKPNFLAAMLTAAMITISGLICYSALAQGVANDPYASNNGNFPSRSEYTGPLTVANLNYDFITPTSTSAFVSSGAITVQSAPAYLDGLKKYLAPTIGKLINAQAPWDPATNGWYDMIWIGQGKSLSNGSLDLGAGREPISNTYTGQIEMPQAYLNRFDPSRQGPLPKGAVQNHAAIYYNDIAAGMLAKLWANPYQPDIEAINFPNGSVAVKVEAVTTPASQWQVTQGASQWKVYRPSVPQNYDPINPPDMGPAKVINVYPIQLSIAVKDTIASPQTGWVYAAFVYDAAASGATPWDRFVSLGAIWGNDPKLAVFPDGNNGSPANLQETYFNEKAPFYVHGTMGWGGRLSGPNDVGGRQNVIFVGGGNQFVNQLSQGASSCLSCHSAAEYPWTQNLYPSPNRAFPHDGAPFVLFNPGSPQWQRWFQNRPGRYGVSEKVFPRGLDYDYAIMFALQAQASAVGNEGYSFDDFKAH